MTERMRTSGKSLPSIHICKALGYHTIHTYMYIYMFFDQMTYGILLFIKSLETVTLCHSEKNFKASQKLKCKPYSLIALLLPPKIYAWSPISLEDYSSRCPLNLLPSHTRSLLTGGLSIKTFLIIFFKLNQFFLTKIS